MTRTVLFLLIASIGTLNASPSGPGAFPLVPGADLKDARPGTFTLFEMADEAVDGYIVWLPVDFDLARRYPVIMSLHSSGQTGQSVETALLHGPGKALVDPDPRFDPLRSSFIIIFPHLCDGPYAERQWFDRTDTLDSIFIDVIKAFPCDPSRLYLLGYSTGGTGSWGYASSHPLDFAAIIPVAGFTKPDLGIKKPIIRDWASLSRIPVWAIYNVFDKAVSYNHIRAAITAIEATGGAPFMSLAHDAVGPPFRENVIMDTSPSEIVGVRRISSIYKIGIHAEGNVWANPILYEWLLSHKNEDCRGGVIVRSIAASQRNQIP